MAVALLFPVGASGAEYLVGTEAELRAALGAAMTDGDPTATIRFIADITITTPSTSTFNSPVKPVSFDTQGFSLIRNSGAAGFTFSAASPRTFNGNYLGGSAGQGGTGLTLLGPSAQVTVNGTVTGGDSSGAFAGGAGVFVSGAALTLTNNGSIKGGDASGAGMLGGTGVSLAAAAGATVINNGSITGGAASTTGAGGGTGVSAAGAGAMIINNGAIKGGGGGVGFTAANNGFSTGVSLAVGTSLVNSATGLIVGGDASGGMAGAGVTMNTSTAGSVINQGTIRGGADLSGGAGGGRGIRVGGGTNTIENSGLIEGGAGNVAIYALAPGTTLTVVNSGTIRAGSGNANAIEFGTSGISTLELQAGSNIVGNVVAGAGTSDAFRLGGATNAVFDISTIGDTAQYRFFDTFTKTGTSTWALIGTGTVTAPWTVDQGTLQIGNGGTSGSLTSNVVVNDGATLAFNRSDTYTFSNLVSGAGGVAQNGTGTTVFNTAQTYTGPTTVNLGTLAIDGSITSPVAVNAAGTLSGSGTIFGNVTNTGTVTPGGGSGVLTIAGNYIGNGGTVRVNTALGGDSSATGRLLVSGDTSGTSQLRVVNVGGTGALTSEGIKVIDVQGASNGTFTLAGDYTFQGQQAVVGGAYAYRLYKNGASTPTDGDWYLRSTLLDPASVGTAAAAASGPLLAPTVPLYEAYSSVLQRFNELGTLQQRVGNRSWSPNASVQAEQEAGKPIIGRGAWARVEGSNTHIDPSTSTTSASYNVRMWKFEGGVDAPVIQNQSGTLVVGPTFHYGIANSSVSSMFGNGSVDATGYGFGGTATWYGNNGSYVDARATLTWYDTDIRSSTLATKLANGNRGSGVATSVEAGHQLALGGNWSITPQAQLAWSQVRFDAFTDQYGTNVSRDNGNSLVSRLGVSLDHETRWMAANGKTQRSHIYGITNLYYDFLHGTSARVADISVVSKEQALWAGLGIGASLNWNDDRYTVYGELLARTSLQNFGDSNAIGAKFGFRYRW
ncbi:autotransporter outer membrane beta-barrel domain-containing protein [Cupriavidus pauculus]|uniref:autotransporter family protein n=1 Tax=Cupriavidus pauculus TaxID=82633 RepID=UPI001EE394D0|nr:autotransporter outer membrane beta-barrel domain-containing protein [Cupriavidus pauculus]GJG96773.1 autotransporter outer membrane beta-barrel domain-containing protein [Cupriavidus pauculus]